MPYTVPTFADIRANYLRDVRNLRPQAHINGDSDHFVRGSAVSSAADGLYDYQAWIARQLFPDTADPEYLEAHAALRGLTLKPATFAQGGALLLGTPGADVLPGLTIKLEGSDDLYITTGGGNLAANGTLQVPCRAVVAGACADLVAAPALLQSPPPGVEGACLLYISGGTDATTHAELLAELQYYMRNPPGGGNKYDYVRWAMQVPGVTAAWCYPHRRYVGAVDVVIISADGLPSPELVAAVQAHIDFVRPVACPNVLVLGPVPHAVVVTAGLRLTPGYTVAGLRSQAADLLAQYFAGIVPGGEVIRARLEALLLSLPGVIDAQLLTPAANIAAEALEWPRLGELILEAL